MPTFSDQLLVDIVKKAARRVNRKLCLFGTSDEIIIDNTGEMTSPDPAKNGDLYDLVLLQAECLITQREFQTELRDANGGVMIRDGEQVVDRRAAGVARGTFYDSSNSPCAEIMRELKIEKFNRAGGSGKCIW